MNNYIKLIGVMLGLLLSLTGFFTVLWYLFPIIEKMIQITYINLIELFRLVWK